MARLMHRSRQVGICRQTDRYDETFVLPQENLGMTKTWIRVAVILFLYLKAPIEVAEVSIIQVAPLTLGSSRGK
jgi:hypothetical protein